MSDFIYQIKFLSDWHCGSGLSGGADMDAAVVRDHLGFPFVPGKTVKGLLREAAENLKEIEHNKDWESFIHTVFGKEHHEEGTAHFTNATLTKEVQKEMDRNTEFLFRKSAFTAVDDESGTAKEKSLREMETVMPLTLYGKITHLDKETTKKMTKCLKMIKRIGTNRNHGFGRCVLSITGGKK